MRCLFTMFAEDVGLLPNHSFMQLLADIRQDPASFKPMLEHLWATMNTAAFRSFCGSGCPSLTAASSPTRRRCR
jgi:hypothetical protein